MTADALQRLFLTMENLVKEYRESANAQLSDLDLRGAEIVCLQTLMYHPDGLSVSDLAGASERDKAQISRTMKSLSKKAMSGKSGGCRPPAENPVAAVRSGRTDRPGHAGKECSHLGGLQPAAQIVNRFAGFLFQPVCLAACGNNRLSLSQNSGKRLQPDPGTGIMNRVMT